MVKRILIILMALVLLVPGINLTNVYATLSSVSFVNADTNVGEQTYTFDIVSFGTKYTDVDYCEGYISSGSLTIEGRYLVGYRTVSSSGEVRVKIFVYNSSGYDNMSEFMTNINSIYSPSYNAETKYGRFNYTTLAFDYNGDNSLQWSSSNILASLEWDECDYMDRDNPGKLVTNMPIFSSEEEAIAFMNGELTEKDAFNYDTDLCDIKYDLEMPQDMKVTNDDGFISSFLGNDADYTFEWKQSDPNYINWDTQFYYYLDVDAYESFLGVPIGDKYFIEDIYAGNDVISTYKLKKVKCWNDFDSDIIWDKINELYPFATSMTEVKWKVYIRNSFFDGEIQHYSNWVMVELDLEDNIISIVELGGSVDDNPGASTPDNDIVGSVVQDSVYDGTLTNTDQSNSDIVGYISNGFGFTGDNGIIAIIAEGFSFIPSEFWSVFLAGIALMVAIAVLKFARG